MSEVPEGLVRVDPTEPGCTRRRRGRGWSFYDCSGEPITDPVEIARIKALVIPPAWQDVWICPDADGHIQAIGIDAAGRKQYRYHARWSECRDEVKYSSLADFAHALPKLRDKIDADLRLRGLPRRAVLLL